MAVSNGVSFVRYEAQSLLPIWFLIRDCIEGDAAIKGEFGVKADYYSIGLRIHSQARKYLPQPNPTDQSLENQARYRQYVERAYWYNFTSRTLGGLVGQVFLRPPVIDLPSQLEKMKDDADGNGLSLLQVAKQVTTSAMAYGRGGLLTDYPATGGANTAADVASGKVQPTITAYYPWQIRNWATRQIGAKWVLSMLVLEEIRHVEEDFALCESINFRVLRLDPTTGNYTVQLYQQVDPKSKANIPQMKPTEEPVTPTNAAGQPFKYIPFSFVGAEANDPCPDKPPIYDLAILNIGHYRNSADYEESCHMVGQPTPVISGLTEEWATNILKGSVTLGARAAIMLPENAAATLLQATANSMPLEAMKLKEEQAIALGAKLVMNQKTVRTATEVVVDTTSEGSVLHNVSMNVSAAMEANLRWAAEFAGGDASAIKYQLNTEFELMRMNVSDLLTVVKVWQTGGIAWEEMRNTLRVYGLAQLGDDVAKQKIAAEIAVMVASGAIADPMQTATPGAPENQPKPAGAL